MFMELRSICLSLVSSELGLENSKRLWSRVLQSVAEYPNIHLDGVVTPNSVGSVDECLYRVVVVGTGGTEKGIIGLGERSRFLVLISFREFNSFAAALEASSQLLRLGKRFEHIPTQSVDGVADSVERVIRAVNAATKLRSSRLGVIGGASDWLVYSKVDPGVVRQRIGAEVVEIPIEELVSEYQSIEEPNASDLQLNPVSVNIDFGEVRKALRMYRAVENLVKRYRLDGVTIRCFDLISVTGTTPCLALAILNTRRVPAACEGDAPLLISMALGLWATGEPVFMGNTAYVDRDHVYLAHCTAPLVAPYSLYTHFESGKGVGVRVEYPVNTEATVFRVDPDLTRLRIGAGVIEPREWSTNMCRTQIRLRLRNAREIISKPMDNHYALILGNHVEELSLAAKILGLEVELIY
jgi:L-fucose isomerase-like protein